MKTAKYWYAIKTSGEQGLIYEEDTGKNIAVTYNSEDAMRIAACVNACNGISNEELESGLSAHYAQ